MPIRKDRLGGITNKINLLYSIGLTFICACLGACSGSQFSSGSASSGGKPSGQDGSDAGDPSATGEGDLSNSPLDIDNKTQSDLADRDIDIDTDQNWNNGDGLTTNKEGVALDRFYGEEQKFRNVTTYIGIDNSGSMEKPKQHIFNELPGLVNFFLDDAKNQLYLVGASFNNHSWNPPAFNKPNADRVSIAIDSCNMLDALAEAVDRRKPDADHAIHFVAVTDDEGGGACKGNDNFNATLTGPAFKSRIEGHKFRESHLAWVAEEIGGEHVTVRALLEGTENAHYVDAVPEYIRLVANADVVCMVGLDLEIGWIPKVLSKSGNAQVQKGGKGYCDLSHAVEPLEKPTGEVDGSHPSGRQPPLLVVTHTPGSRCQRNR